MSNGRPGFSVTSPQDACYMQDHSIDEQVGMYAQKTQPGMAEMNSRAGQLPSAPDDRFSNVIGTLDDATK